MTRVSENRRDEPPTLRCESQDWYTDCKPSRLKAECTHLKRLQVVLGFLTKKKDILATGVPIYYVF